ncbi:MAG: AbrB family transcriptional regulator [Streptococcaceae bacterium]|jgi:antitoxin component of MazEF toxin-antitoxin module|nr:AbrB family transcriptional regulator [Streptococcaceae bacterium]
MTTVKTRKVGNSMTITIPKKMNIEAGREYVAYQGVDEVLVFSPRIKNPLDSIEPMVMEDDFSEIYFTDHEVD